ncbi:hypothetical protein OFN04_33565, partial [Escherichia coli]|nr:hypothetical protein [Escherichia coli]
DQPLQCQWPVGDRHYRPVSGGLACGLLAILGLWAAGLLLSFALNYSHIATVAGKARDLVAPPSVSDYQLTALHALRNEA